MHGQLVERRLAAILAADVAGYSRLMGADEEGTLARLKALRRELHRSEIAEHQAASSRPPATACWSSLPASSMRCAARSRCSAAWPSAMPGARGRAASIAHRHQSRRRHRRGRRHLRRRRQYRGAARSPGRTRRDLRFGHVCATRSGNSLTVAFDDLGEQQVKNIARPVRVYRALAGSTSGRRLQTAYGAAAARQAVDRGAAVPEHERRPGAGIFRRRHGRGDHHRALAASAGCSSSPAIRASPTRAKRSM